MTNDWYQRMIDILQLNGKGERTQQAYARSVGMLSQFYGKTPDLVTEQDSRNIFCNAKTSITGLPRPCASAIAGYASSTRRFLSAS